jgi:predicted O-methyltransferase YrrM
MTGTGEQSASDRLAGMLLGHQATEIAAIGVRSGLFAAIAARPGAGDADIAREHDLAPRYVAAWTRGAYAHGFLDLTADGGYQLAPHMERLLLDPTAPTYVGGRFRLASALGEDYRCYPELLRTGEAWPRSEHGDEILAALADSTTPDASMIVEHALAQLPEVRARLEGGGSALDLGAGGGVLAVHLATAFPAATVHAVESDGPSLALARRRVADGALADRVDLRALDAADLDDRDRHDLATMNLVLHETGGPSRQHDVLCRTYRALRPGGGLVVSELPYPDEVGSYRSDPVHRRLAGLRLHEEAVGCAAITQQQLLDRVAAAGFVGVRAIDQPRTSRYVVVATKT